MPPGGRTPFNRYASAAPPPSKIGPVSTDRNVAQAPEPATDTGRADSRTMISTYFTSAPVQGQATPILYNGDRLWAYVDLTLESAGPVAVGTMSQITPVLSGKGELLTTNVPKRFTIAKGTKLYIAATTLNRVKVEISPVPWLEVVVGLISRLVGKLAPSAATAAPQQKPRTKY